MSEEREQVKCLIIGSGPAGYAAAIYAARADLGPVLYQGLQPGGQLTETTDVDNYPGYPKGIDGPQMMIDFQSQAERFDTDVRTGWVTKVDFSGPKHIVEIDNGSMDGSEIGVLRSKLLRVLEGTLVNVPTFQSQDFEKTLSRLGRCLGRR